MHILKDYQANEGFCLQREMIEKTPSHHCTLHHKILTGHSSDSVLHDVDAVFTRGPPQVRGAPTPHMPAPSPGGTVLP